MQSLSRQVAYSCCGCRGRAGRPLAAAFRTFAAARRSAAACLRRAVWRALTAFRFRCRSAVACFRMRALKSVFGVQSCRIPRCFPHSVQVAVTRGRSFVRAFRRLLVALVTHVWVMPLGFPQVPHVSSPPPSFTPMAYAFPDSGQIGVLQQNRRSARGTGCRTTPAV